MGGGQEQGGVAIYTVIIRAGLTGKVILSKEGDTEHGDARERSRQREQRGEAPVYLKKGTETA